MKVKENLWLAGVIVCVAIVTRVIPHYPNFTALGAAAIFGGAHLSRKYAFLVPVIALFISDLLLNNLIYAQQFPDNYHGFVFFETGSLWSYGAFLIIVFIATLLGRGGKFLRVAGTTVAASLIFFIVTNFGVWTMSALYPKDPGGLALAYAAGLPFFWSTLAGDFFFVAIFFGGYEIVKAFTPKRVDHPA